MAGTSIYSVYRRTARAAAKQQVVRKTSTVDVEKARKNFAYFCDVVGGKPPAKHHLSGTSFYVQEMIVNVLRVLLVLMLTYWLLEDLLNLPY